MFCLVSQDSPGQDFDQIKNLYCTPYLFIYYYLFWWCWGWNPARVHAGPVLYTDYTQPAITFLLALLAISSTPGCQVSRLCAQQLACICSPQQNDFVGISPFYLIKNNLHVLMTLLNKLLTVLCGGKNTVLAKLHWDFIATKYCIFEEATSKIILQNKFISLRILKICS